LTVRMDGHAKSVEHAGHAKKDNPHKSLRTPSLP
jgi:hypothetical protein